MPIYVNIFLCKPHPKWTTIVIPMTCIYTSSCRNAPSHTNNHWYMALVFSSILLVFIILDTEQLNISLCSYKLKCALTLSGFGQFSGVVSERFRFCCPDHLSKVIWLVQFVYKAISIGDRSSYQSIAKTRNEMGNVLYVVLWIKGSHVFFFETTTIIYSG